LSEVTKLADASCVARTIGVFTVSAHLTPTHTVVASVALPFSVEWLVRVGAVRYLSPAYFHSILLFDLVLRPFDLLEDEGDNVRIL
jgi:hypothetical protein